MSGTGERVEQLLDELRSGGQPRSAAVAEELVSCLVGLYGAGLTRVVEILGADAEAGARLLDLLTADPLVESLLLVHDLHPLDVDTRIQRALDRVRPYLGSHAGGVDYRGVDDQGVVHLRLEGSCQGCPSSTITVRMTIEQAVAEAAPETTGVDVAGVAEPAAPAGPKLLQITPRRREPVAAPAAPAASWKTLSDPGALVGPGPHRLALDGLALVLCRLDQALYAYRDTCPGCAAALSTGVLTGTVLACPGCASRYDVRLAGAGLDEPRRHLQPLPLLVEDGQVRIATGAPAMVAS